MANILPRQTLRGAREERYKRMMADREKREQELKSNPKATPSQPKRFTMGTMYEDLPLMGPSDCDFLSRVAGFIDKQPAYVTSFEDACRSGDLETVRSIASEENCTPAFLHWGLTLALCAGNVKIADYLLDAGAPIVRQTPINIFSAPHDKQIPLFEVLIKHKWTPNTPGVYGEVLLPRVITNRPLLEWFLKNNANPNLGEQTYDRLGGPDTQSGLALEKAAANGDLDVVHMLLKKGARIEYGVPLHYAAARVCPPGENPSADSAKMTPEFDRAMIPMMKLLVESGADVNKKEESRYRIPRYAIVHAVRVGAVQRVRWLLEQGANPTLKGDWGSAVSHAQEFGSDEMKEAIEEGLVAGKWVKNETNIEPTQ